MARSDEIDELVSSVRNLVSYKDGDLSRKMPPQGRLPDHQPPAASADVLVLRNAVTPGSPSLGDRVAELEVAVTARAEDWEPDGGETMDQAAWAASAFDLPQDDPVKLFNIIRIHAGVFSLPPARIKQVLFPGRVINRQLMNLLERHDLFHLFLALCQQVHDIQVNGIDFGAQPVQFTSVRVISMIHKQYIPVYGKITAGVIRHGLHFIHNVFFYQQETRCENPHLRCDE